MAKCLARQFGKTVETVPVRLVHKSGDRLRGPTVTSIDGVGAYDHVHRSAMLAKLLEIPELQGPLKFARFACAETTTYVWEDDEGVRHHIRQGEGGEQGDPLMPLLFSLGVHNALAAGKSRMAPGEHLLAFLDDTYILSLPQRARPLYDVMDTTLETGAGIQLHTGKTRIWNRGGIRPQDIDDLGEEVWSPEGVRLQLDQKRSSKLSQTGDSRRNADCGMRSRQCLICSALGSCCNAQAHDAITC